MLDGSRKENMGERKERDQAPCQGPATLKCSQ